MKFRILFAIAGALLLTLAGCGADIEGPESASVAAASSDPLADPPVGEWLMDGHDYTAQRYSRLTQIDASNVSQLGLAWYDDLDTYRGVEATPLYADGVLYNTLAWNITTAYDAKTGAKLWTYDPKTPREYGRYACCEPVARGLALWNGKVIIATLDGRLIALDKDSGKPVWTTRAFPEDSQYAYSITGAPRVFDGQGRDWRIRRRSRRARVRRRLRCRDRPETVEVLPHPQSRGQARRRGLRRGHGDDAQDLGRHRPVDASLAAEPIRGIRSPTIPMLDLVYVGTGNSSPHSRFYRSNNEGDNLFTCSIVALARQGRDLRLALPDEPGRGVGLDLHRSR